MVDAVREGGLVLDLQVIRPNPVVEVAGRFVCEIDGEPLFVGADAATAAVDALVAAGELVEEAVDDHDMYAHFEDGADLVEDYADRIRRLPEDAIPDLLAIREPCQVRELCRLRRLRVSGRPAGRSA